MKNERISLCVITGNCEAIMPRFLSSFQGIADEICIVRAIGNQDPDKTLEICQAAGCRVGQYENKNDWPHVDNFAAARNLAFSMASHEWVMWADIDDTIDERSIAELRRMVEGAGPDVELIQCPYVVPDQFARVMRERIMRRGKFVWQNPVHECVTPVNKKQFHFQTAPTACVTHAPKENRKGSNERNLRILGAIPESERGAGHYFYTFSENMGLERFGAAVEAGQKFLQHPGSSGPERYEVWLGLAGVPELPPDQVATFLHSAYRENPSRAEALYELANLELTCGTIESALAYSRALRALPVPTSEAWNSRRRFYGWAGEQMETQAMRASGLQAKADALDFNRWRAAGGKISLLHATRGRVAMASRARRNWMERAENPAGVEHIFAIDDTDTQGREFLTRFRHVLVSDAGGCVAAWNAAAQAAAGEVLIQVSDDWLPPWGWDKLILERLGDTSAPKVLAVSDGARKDDLLCMAILTRARLEQQAGHVFHPSFLSMYSDNFFSECAYADGVVIDAKDLVFEHLHPAFGKGEMDETYSASNAPARYSQGEGTLRRLNAGVKTWKEVQGWCDFTDLYDEIAEKLQDGDTFVEVGSWKGQSLIYLGHRLQDLGKTGVSLVAVDTFKGDAGTGFSTVREEFDSNVLAAGLSNMVTAFESLSTTAAEGFIIETLAGVFIDAAHDYENAKADIAAWLPKVRDDGIFAGHDFDAAGVQKAVSESLDAEPVSRRCWRKK